MERVEIDALVIGAGVVGLAVAEALTRHAPGRSVAVVERHPGFGREASSHNSEVIHAGLYYPAGSNKARFCVAGRGLLYAFCERHGVPHRRCGKYVVATSTEQLPALERVRSLAAANGVALTEISASAAREATGAQVVAALWSPLTGIVDSHALMERLAANASARGAMLLYEHGFASLVDRASDRVTVQLAEPSGRALEVAARAVINCAGLGAARVANAFFDGRYGVRACRGRYFDLASKWTGRFSHLLYPVPDPAGGLGIHLTIDTAGAARLGPDLDWQTGASSDADDPLLYRFDAADEAMRERFYDAGRGLIPRLALEDLSPGFVGVRAKLFVDGRAHEDFAIIQSAAGARDWHLLGIESPGLTAALALADDVSSAAARAL